MYTVVAQRQIPAPVEKVWDHLTKPELLAKWFADTSYIGPDTPVCMETAGGDFFAGRVIEWDPGIVLGLRWKFLGCGPEYEVRFSLLRRKQGTELTVQDRGALTVEEAECLRVGWSEFLMRFEKSLLTNVNARFNWRKVVNVTIRVAETKQERLARATEALALVALADRAHHFPSQMSGGQQQRVAIARALVNHPSILLADEPTGNLDSRTSVEIMAVLQRLNDAGLTIVLVTHEHDIAQFAKRVIVFRDGKVRKDEAVVHRPDADDVLKTLPSLED